MPRLRQRLLLPPPEEHDRVAPGAGREVGCKVTARELSVRAEFENLGFNEVDTGGGCTAWVLTLSHGRECLVTDGDLSAPLDMASPAVLSIMHDGCGEPIKQLEFVNVKHLLAWLDTLDVAPGLSTVLAVWAGGQ